MRWRAKCQANLDEIDVQKSTAKHLDNEKFSHMLFRFLVVIISRVDYGGIGAGVC